MLRRPWSAKTNPRVPILYQWQARRPSSAYSRSDSGDVRRAAARRLYCPPPQPTPRGGVRCSDRGVGAQAASQAASQEASQAASQASVRGLRSSSELGRSATAVSTKESAQWVGATPSKMLGSVRPRAHAARIAQRASGTEGVLGIEAWLRATLPRCRCRWLFCRWLTDPRGAAQTQTLSRAWSKGGTHSAAGLKRGCDPSDANRTALLTRRALAEFDARAKSRALEEVGPATKGALFSAPGRASTVKTRCLSSDSRGRLRRMRCAPRAVLLWDASSASGHLSALCSLLPAPCPRPSALGPRPSALGPRPSALSSLLSPLKFPVISPHFLPSSLLVSPLHSILCSLLAALLPHCDASGRCLGSGGAAERGCG